MRCPSCGNENREGARFCESCGLERDPAYAEADIHVKSGDGAHRDVVDAIVRSLEEHLAKKNAT